MKMKIKYAWVVLSLLCMGVYAQKPERVYTIHPAQTLQTIDNFGASDGWSMRFLGTWPAVKQRQIADWLFSTEVDETGKPKGIGLSLWRFNVGAGSVEQGDSSKINFGTRTECFLTPNGTYDWSKQEGQRNFLRLAKERGVNQFLGFLNSPPVYFTKNGLATNTGRDGTFNLRPECYADFANFLANVVQGLEKHDDIRLDYLCVVNEPDGHWNWQGPKQEGSPATNREVASIVRKTAAAFQKRNIQTKLLVNESSDYRCMFSVHETDWQRGYAIQSFFSPDSTDTYLGNTPNVPRMMAGHSYWTNTPLKSLRDYRVQLRDTLDKYRVGFWQTEVCIMGNDEEIGGGGGYDRTMKTALYVARIIHHDLVYARASAWQWWRSAGGDYKDGLLYYEPYKGRDDDGEVTDSKLLWALGNYSRFVRPGATRLSLTAADATGKTIEEGDTDPQGVMCSAYRNADGSLVMVAINYSQEEKTVRLAVDGTKKLHWKAYRTSDAEGENLAPVSCIDKKGTATLAPRSIVTFIGLGK